MDERSSHGRLDHRHVPMTLGRTRLEYPSEAAIRAWETKNASLLNIDRGRPIVAA